MEVIMESVISGISTHKQQLCDGTELIRMSLYLSGIDKYRITAEIRCLTVQGVIC